MHRERIDHHGRPANWFLDFPAAYLDSLVADLKEIELVFQLEFGLAVYLTWGTLLGAMRDSDLIPYDYDIDIAYVSRARTPAGIVAERRRIIDHFQRFGRISHIPNGGQFMICTTLAPSGNYDHGIDIWTSYASSGAHYAYPTVPGVL